MAKRRTLQDADQDFDTTSAPVVEVPEQVVAVKTPEAPKVAKVVVVDDTPKTFPEALKALSLAKAMPEGTRGELAAKVARFKVLQPILCALQQGLPVPRMGADELALAQIRQNKITALERLELRARKDPELRALLATVKPTVKP